MWFRGLGPGFVGLGLGASRIGGQGLVFHALL